MNQTILIVGAGPVGLTMASEAARYKLPVRIVDVAAERSTTSKALVLWSRTLELLERGDPRGASPFVTAGMACRAVNIVAIRNAIGRIEFDKLDSSYPFALMLPQSETERLLEERLARQGVAVERGVKLLSFTPRENGVDVVLQHADGREEACTVGWLVGCDGAHSTVRHGLGVPFAGETHAGGFVLADAHLSGYPFPDNEMAIYWHRDGVLAFFPIVPGRYRVIADLPASDKPLPGTPTLEQVQALLDERGPGGVSAFDPVWLSAFTVNSRKVASYRYGRVFLAGDAAHIHSPAGGQGMNTGMQDAFNLAWKLSLVVRGTCDDHLLDSYSCERSGVGDDVLKMVGRMTRFGTLHNPAAQAVRNLVGRLVLGLAPAHDAAASAMSEISLGYARSPLNGPSLRGGPLSGGRLSPSSIQGPQGVADTAYFMLCAEQTAEVELLVHQFAGLLDPDVQMPLRDGAIHVIRPDGYIACSSDRVADVARYLDDLTTRRPQ